MYTGQVRQAVVAAGHWLVGQGVIRTVDELFWLHFAEINELLHTPDAFDVAARLATRQAAYHYWQTLETPPILGIPDADLPERSPATAMDEVTRAGNADPMSSPGTIEGLGASHGRGAGQARVAVDSFAMPDLQPGDILLAANIGPMWTPLLPILGGLVLEKGSVGQHAAATAREYGVPTVIQAKDALRLIPEGSWSTVDGASGTVAY